MPVTSSTIRAPKQTAKSIGFFKDPNKTDVLVYDIYGPTFPKGIMFSYGISLDNAAKLKISQEEMNHYQHILENGALVGPGQTGIRLVKPKESGQCQNTFKIRDPSHDLIILMELAETITDVKGRKKYLYRAGTGKYH